MSTVRINKIKEQEILHALKNYKKDMGTDLSSFARYLGVTRQRVRVVAREHGIPLPFKDEFYRIYEQALKEDILKLERMVAESRKLDLTKIGVAKSRKKISKSKTETKKAESAKVTSSTKEKVVAITTASKVTTKDKPIKMKESKVKAKQTTSTAVNNAKTISIAPEVQKFLVDNSNRPWTHLAKETGLSYYMVRRFLKSKGLQPARGISRTVKGDRREKIKKSEAR